MTAAGTGGERRLGVVPEQRKLVTVLLVDTVGSTSTRQAYGSEMIRSPLGRHFARAEGSRPRAPAGAIAP